MSEIPFQQKKTRSGKTFLKYSCPQCGERLESPLEEAGKRDNCPSCTTTFVVPGVAILKQLEAKKKKVEEAKQAARLAEQKKLELHLREKQKEDELRRKEEKARQALEATERFIQDEEKRKIEAKRERELAANHGEYEYKVVLYRKNHDDMAGELEKTINKFAAKGWEYMHIEIVKTRREAGCLGELLGLPGETLIHELAIFRRPFRRG